jgi:hypothetical protein
MSYLRGPLTREEIAQLMKGRAVAAPSASRRTSEGPPVLPPPLEHHFLSRHGGQLAEPCVFVKYAARYKDAGESIALKAWPLEAASAADALESEPIELTEEELADEAPAGLRYSDLPVYATGQNGARAIEKALKDRLASKLEAVVWFDPVTQAYGLPGEDAEVLAKRLLSAGPGPQEADLRDRLEKKKRELANAERGLSERKKETWLSVGSAILSNLPLLMGRRRSVSITGANAVLTRNRMENEAEQKVEDLRAEVAELDQKVTGLMVVDSSRFEQRPIAPVKSDVKVLRFDLVWVY